MPEVAAELRQIVNREIPHLNALSDDRAKSPIAPGKWSPQEIIGHLGCCSSTPYASRGED